MDSEQTFIASGEDVTSLPGYVYIGFSSNTEKGLALYKDWRTLKVIGAKDVQEVHKNRGLINLAVTKDEWDHPEKYGGDGIPDTHPLRGVKGLKKHPPIPVQEKVAPKKMASKVRVKILSALSLKKEEPPQIATQTAVAVVEQVTELPQPKTVSAPEVIPEKVAEDWTTITLSPKTDSKCNIKVTIGADGKRVRVNELFFRSSGRHIAELEPGTYGAKLLMIESSKHLAFDTSTVPLSFGASLGSLEQRMRPETGYKITIEGLEDKLPQQ